MSKSNFLESLNDFNADLFKVSSMEDELLRAKKQLEERLNVIINGANLSIADKNNILLKSINELKASTQRSIKAWDNKLQKSLPMKALSEQYADRIIFLIFGKVNAGKSSFANFLTEQFPKDQVRRFCFNNGKVEYFGDDQRFAEGVTETTATIQGVELGCNFVLLDSPGLHSVTDENGALTQQFIDSTDAVLWLTPSTSPGQVQELQDLKVELEKGKPLQPVITRSDVIEEDVCEETNDIIAIVKNKSESNRKLQEDDVLIRIKHIKLNVPIKPPVSISVHAYNKTGKSQQALDEAGLSALFVRLIDLVDEAKRYKVDKTKSQMVIFLEKEMLEPLKIDLIPKIEELGEKANNNIKALNKKKESLTSIIVSDVVCAIPSIVNKHKNSRNKHAISVELNNLIESQINSVLQQELSEFVSQVKRTSSSLSSDKIGDFEDITIDITQVKGNGAKSASSSIGGVGGAAGGAALGSMIMPGVGTVIGGVIGALLGGAAGSAVGDYFVETEIITERVGVRTDQIISETTKVVKNTLPNMIDDIFQDAIKSIQSVKEFSDKISSEIATFGDDVQTLKDVRL